MEGTHAKTTDLPLPYKASFEAPPEEARPDLGWKQFYTVDVLTTKDVYTIYAWQQDSIDEQSGTKHTDFGYGYNSSGPEYYFSCSYIPVDGKTTFQVQVEAAYVLKGARTIMKMYLQHRRIYSCTCSLASFRPHARTGDIARGPTPQLDASGLKHFALDVHPYRCKALQSSYWTYCRAKLSSWRLSATMALHSTTCMCGCLREEMPQEEPQAGQEAKEDEDDDDCCLTWC